jgi:hypothetical protein
VALTQFKKALAEHPKRRPPASLARLIFDVTVLGLCAAVVFVLRTEFPASVLFIVFLPFASAVGLAALRALGDLLLPAQLKDQVLDPLHRGVGIAMVASSMWLGFVTTVAMGFLIAGVLLSGVNFLLTHQFVLPVRLPAPLTYVQLVVTLLFLAFGKRVISVALIPRLLTGIFWRLSPLDVNHRLLLRSMLMVNYRRRAYELAILAFLLSVSEQLTGHVIVTLPFWSRVSPLALNALLTFVAVATYISSFEPRLLTSDDVWISDVVAQSPKGTY